MNMENKNIIIHVAKYGNHFMEEIANIFNNAILNNGLVSFVALDKIPQENCINIIIAPHEYFPLFGDKFIEFNILDNKSTFIIMINVEQPGSQWFELSCNYFKYADYIFDISSIGYKEILNRGFKVDYLPLGFSEILKSSLIKEKDIDIIFLGHCSPKRELFFARHSRVLSNYNCLLLFNYLEEPRKPGDSGYYEDTEISGLIQRSKICINIHSFDRSYFEWHRIIKCIINKAVVVTELSVDTEPLENEISFYNKNLDEIIPTVEYLLKNEDLRNQIAHNAYNTLYEKRSMNKLILKMIREVNKIE
jgi:hypothetical protein